MPFPSILPSIVPSQPTSRRGDDDDNNTTTAEESVAEMQPSSTDDSDDPVSLEGSLLFRRGRYSSKASFGWKKRFVVFSFENGGSVTIYKVAPGADGKREDRDTTLRKRPLHGAVSRLQKNFHLGRIQPESPVGEIVLQFDVDMPWVAKDVEYDHVTFVIEIPCGEESSTNNGDSNSTDSDTNNGDIHSVTALSETRHDDSQVLSISAHTQTRNGDAHSMGATSLGDAHSKTGRQTISPRELLEREMRYCDNKNKTFRVYFRCKRNNEKALWLKAFSRQFRLSSEKRKRKGMMNTLFGPGKSSAENRGQLRRESSMRIASDALDLDMEDILQRKPSGLDLLKDISLPPKLGNDAEQREYKVQPQHAYPHRWMTIPEMTREMLLPSEKIHDLHSLDCKEKLVGTFKVEVLQCLGLPKLEKAQIDAVVYMVVGSHAFTTDVIENHTNPMWMRKTRRGCLFPLYHGYARMYVGVFDDGNSERTKDNFTGRVVVDISRLRPNSTYDVLLPLRLSTHVYTRRRRGAIRLRFTLKWTNEREALLSYIPKKFELKLPQDSKPNRDVTVRCADKRAFRNIAYTVHGAHIPGRFTFQHLRAVLREINFVRKYVFMELKQQIIDLRRWENPLLSAFIFIAWMHCIIANALSLVPGYVCIFFLLNMMRTYAKFVLDPRRHRGFIPPTWEELMMALLRTSGSAKGAIEAMVLGPRSLMRRANRSTFQTIKDENGQSYRVATHNPLGIKIFRSLGFLPSEKYGSYEHGNLEFPFASSIEYPRLTVREVIKKEDDGEDRGWHDNGSMMDGSVDNSLDGSYYYHSPEKKLSSRPALDSDEKDAEEAMFAAHRVVVQTGKRALSNAADHGLNTVKSGIKAAAQVGEITGINSGLNTVKSGIKTGVRGVETAVQTGVRGVQTGVRGVQTGVRGVQHGLSFRRTIRDDSKELTGKEIGFEEAAQHEATACEDLAPTGSEQESAPTLTSHERLSSDLIEYTETGAADVMLRSTGETAPTNEDAGENETPSGDASSVDDMNPLTWPDQDMDIEGPSTGNSLTDDLADIKDKMHEMTWHLFDDIAYVVKDPDAMYFGDSKKPEKRRKTDVTKELEKLLGTGQHSHPNPFVARLGLYVEPLMEAAYSFLCLSRACFNVITWQDPMLSFWVSLLCGLASFILFILPWRIFLFFLGWIFVGPHNWLIRVLRENGHLPQAKMKSNDMDSEKEDYSRLPTDKPVALGHHRHEGNSTPDLSDINPHEIQQVVVPYGPLQYQRFYDWPPEPEHAHVMNSFSTEEDRRRRYAHSVSHSVRQAMRQSDANLRVPTRNFGRLGAGLGVRRRARSGTYPSNMTDATHESSSAV